MARDILAGLEELGCIVVPTGSRVYCNPAPTDTDEDYLVFDVEACNAVRPTGGYVVWSPGGPWDQYYEKLEIVWREILGAGFKEGGSIPAHTGGGFTSYRKDDVNLIVTQSREFFENWMIAHGECLEKNYLDKADRIRCFERVWAEQREKKAKEERRQLYLKLREEFGNE